MASAEASSPPVAILPDNSPQPPISSQIPTDSSMPDGNDQQIAEVTPKRSLFGPFPPSEDPSQADQHTTVPLEPLEAPLSSPSDQIEPSSDNQDSTNNPPLNFNPQTQERSTPVPAKEHSSPNNPSLPPLLREKTAPAIGPATDKPNPLPKESEVEGPVLYITLLLSSTGARHPYKLDEKYLRKRNVVVDANNPINISLYKLKELILRDWREGKIKHNVMHWH